MQARKQRECRRVEAVKVSEIAGLVNAVDVGLLGREGEVGLDLGADGAEEAGFDQVGDDAMFVSRLCKNKLLLAACAFLPPFVCLS